MKGVKLTPYRRKLPLKSPALLGLKRLKNQELAEEVLVLTEEATDISNIQQLPIFIRFYDSEKMPQIPVL